MPKMRSFEEQIDAAIEDTEYNTLAPTVECSNKDEFDDLLKTYEEDQQIRELSLTPGWFIIRQRLIDEAERRAQDLRRVDENDDEKVRKKKSELSKADYARNTLINMVEDADKTPRPILVK